MFENIATSLWSAAMTLNLAIAGAPGTTTPPPVQEVIVSETTTQGETQTLSVSDKAPAQSVERDSYTATAAPEPEPVVIPPTTSTSKKANQAVPHVTPDPGSAQAEALNQVTARGWGQDQFNCLVSLWNKESGWNVTAHNASSGAYGIPQSLPGNKMSSVGADWQTNPATQITWGLNYIQDRYSVPCNAWGHSQVKNWY